MKKETQFVLRKLVEISDNITSISKNQNQKTNIHRNLFKNSKVANFSAGYAKRIQKELKHMSRLIQVFDIESEKEDIQIKKEIDEKNKYNRTT